MIHSKTEMVFSTFRCPHKQQKLSLQKKKKMEGNKQIKEKKGRMKNRELF
jgi:hypothetical protein